MRRQIRWMFLLLALPLLFVGCVSLTPPLREGPTLLPVPREVLGAVPTQGLDVNPSRSLVSKSESGALERLHPYRASHTVTVVGADSTRGEAQRRALAAQLAFRGALLDVSGSTHRMASELARLKASGQGLASTNGAFLRYADYGTAQLRWMDTQLAAATRLANTASEVDDPDLQLALLRVAGPRLESALVGSLLLSVWLDFLHLADVALKQHLSSPESLFVDLWRWQDLLEPAMRALSSGEHGQMEAAAQDAPALVGHFTQAFVASVEAMRRGAEHCQRECERPWARGPR